MTCEECIHYDVCDYLPCETRNLYDDMEERCEYIKDKSKFVELPCKVGDDLAKAYSEGYEQGKFDMMNHTRGEWTNDEMDDMKVVCSCCLNEALYKSTFEETFDYDWDEHLVSTGYEEHREYVTTNFCPNCGAHLGGENI